MKLSVVIPAHNEEGCIAATVQRLADCLGEHAVDYEILVVADHCSDGTEAIVTAMATGNPRLQCERNPASPGFGMAVRHGLDRYRGDAVAIYMADGSDAPEDVCRCFARLEAGAECVFGSRFIPGGRVIDYPVHKLLLNRLANRLLQVLFWHGLNDTTNAFKCYRREVIDGCRPLLSVHFNLTVELPLKAVIRGYSYEIVPISWRNRQVGVSKLKIKEMGSRYAFIMFYCFLERLLTGGDYQRRRQDERSTPLPEDAT